MSYICTLNNDLQDRARRCLNEDPDTRDGFIEKIRTWIQQQPHLNIRYDDGFILRFLRGCKFSLQSTKERIDYHYTLKTSLPEFFSNRDPQDLKIREVLKLGIILPLKDTDINGSRIFLVRQGSYDPHKIKLVNFVKALYLLYDVFCEADEIHQINGLGLVIDMEELTLQHLLYYTPNLVKNALEVWQNGYVTQNKYWSFLHVGSMFKIFFNIVKLCLKEEIKGMIRVYESNFDKLYTIVPQRILPKEYGGEGGTVQELTDHWLEIIDSKREWILNDAKNTVDETKRPKIK